MLSRIFLTLAFVVCLVGASASCGCGGPGEVTKGKATKGDFAKTGGVHEASGEEVPDGTMVVD